MTDELVTDRKGVIYNKTLEEEWEKYFELEEEVKILKKELEERSILAHAKGQKIKGMVVKNGSLRVNNEGIIAIFEQKGWPPIMKDMIDYKAMRIKLEKDGISVPKKETSPSVYRRKR